jgi:hypothetical protein
MLPNNNFFLNGFLGVIISFQGVVVYNLSVAVDKLTLKVAEQEATILLLTQVADSAKKEKADLVAAFDPLLAVAFVAIIIAGGLVVLYFSGPSQAGVVEALQLLNTGAAESSIALTTTIGQVAAVQTGFIAELVNQVETRQYITLDKIGDLSDKLLSIERAIRDLSPTISHVGSEVGTRLIANQSDQLVMSLLSNFGP